MRRLPLSPLDRLPGAPAAPGAAGPVAPHPLLRLQQAAGNRAAAGALDGPALESPGAAPASVRQPAAPVPCRGCVGGGGGPVVRR